MLLSSLILILKYSILLKSFLQVFQHWAFRDGEKNSLSPPFQLHFSLFILMSLFKSSTVHLSFPGKEKQICLSLGEGGSGAGFSCCRAVVSWRWEVTLCCTLSAVSDSCWVGAILANHKIDRLMSRDCSFMPSHHMPHKYSHLCPNPWQTTCPFTTPLTPGLRALFWWLFKGVFQLSCLGKKYGEVFVKRSCEENVKRQIEMIIRMIISGCDHLG